MDIQILFFYHMDIWAEMLTPYYVTLTPVCDIQTAVYMWRNSLQSGYFSYINDNWEPKQIMFHPWILY